MASTQSYKSFEMVARGRPGSVHEVLRQVEELELTIKRQPTLRKSLLSMSLKEAYLEVVDLPGREVAAAIEQVMIAVTRNILGGDGFGYSLPCRGSSDQVLSRPAGSNCIEG